MAVLGKDFLDLSRPYTHVKVQFGAMGYWVESDTTLIPYGTVLTQLLNYNDETPLQRLESIFEIYLFAGEDIRPIQKRYTWFLEELFRDAVSEKKKARGKNLWPSRYVLNVWMRL